MQIRMQNGEGLTAEQIKEFLKGNESVSFAGQSQKEVYAWVQRVLVTQEFTQQDKKQRGAIRAYVEKVTGLGSAQVTRLVRRFKETGIVEASAYHRRGFPRKYTDRDIALLAEVDRAHERLSGPATRPILASTSSSAASPALRKPNACTTWPRPQKFRSGAAACWKPVSGALTISRWPRSPTSCCPAMFRPAGDTGSRTSSSPPSKPRRRAPSPSATSPASATRSTATRSRTVASRRRVSCSTEAMAT